MALFGLFGMGNYGNDASLAASLDAIGEIWPNARLSAICTNPSVVQDSFGIPGHGIADAGPVSAFSAIPRPLRLAAWPLLEVARWCSAANYLRDVDVVLVPGTGILDDFGQKPTQLPLDVLRWSCAARLASCHLVFVAIGAGPIEHPLSRRLMRWALAQADFCSYRDSYSLEFMSRLGRNTADDEVWADLVLSIDPGAQGPETGGSACPQTIAIGVMNYSGWQQRGPRAQLDQQRYIERMISLCNLLCAAGHNLLVVTGEDSDRAMAEEVVERLEGDVAIADSAALDDVVNALGTAELLIASRYHNLIAALLLGVPVISLSYAPKNDELLEMYGMRDYSYRIDEFDPAEVAAATRRLLAERNRSTAIRDRTIKLREELRSHLRRLLDFRP